MLKKMCALLMVLAMMLTGAALADADAASSLTEISFDDIQAENMANLMNGGLFAIEGNVLVGLDWDADGRAMLAARKLTGDENIIGDAMALDTNCLASYINVDEGTVYYVRSGLDGENSGIYAVDIAGGDAREILAGDFGSLQLYNGKLYYTDTDNKLFMCGTDGSNFEQIGNLSACYPYVLNDEWLLYQDAAGGETLNVYNMTDGQITVLSNNRSFLPIVKGTWLYYFEKPYAADDEKADRANICRIDLMTLTTERAVGFSGAYLALNGDYMFAANGYKLANEEAWWTIENNAYELLEKAPVFANDDYLISLIYAGEASSRVEVERLADRAAVSFNS